MTLFAEKKKNTISIDNPFIDEEGSETTMDIKANVLNPEEKTIKKQKIKLMHEVVEKLKPRYKTLIQMRYFKEMSYEEISQQLDLPLGTIKAQLFRAREFLAEILKNSEGKI